MGQISILLFCMEYILKITNQRFDNPIILYNKVRDDNKKFKCYECMLN